MIQNGHLVDYESNQETKDNGSDRSCEKSFRRRQKSEADFTRTHEMILKDDNSNGSGFSPIACKGLALRPNSASRTAIAAADSEASLISPISIGSGIHLFLTVSTELESHQVHQICRIQIVALWHPCGQHQNGA